MSTIEPIIPTPLDELAGIVERITEIIKGPRYGRSAIAKARSLPEDAGTVSGRLKVTAGDHTPDDMRAEITRKAEIMCEQIKASMVRDAEIKRDQTLRALAQELETLQGTLKEAVVRVSFEMQYCAGAIRSEATGGL